MISQTPDMQVLTERLEKLERDNQRLKRGAVAGLVLIAALLALAALYTQGRYISRVPDVVKAHELDVLDSAGRARISMRSVLAPVIRLDDSQGRQRVGIGIVKDQPDIDFEDSQGNTAMGLGVFGGRPDIYLDDSHGKQRIGMTIADDKAGLGLSDSEGNTGIVMTVGRRPSVELTDSQGFSMDLGSTETTTVRTGETRRTSAASIVMIGNDKDHHVIWQAP